jgi:hypothetical protein
VIVFASVPVSPIDVGAIIAGVASIITALTVKRDTRSVKVTAEQVKVSTDKINRAVNNVPPGDPTMLELVKSISVRVDEHHASAAVAIEEIRRDMARLRTSQGTLQQVVAAALGKALKGGE